MMIIWIVVCVTILVFYILSLITTNKLNKKIESLKDGLETTEVLLQGLDEANCNLKGKISQLIGELNILKEDVKSYEVTLENYEHLKELYKKETSKDYDELNTESKPIVQVENNGTKKKTNVRRKKVQSRK